MQVRDEIISLVAVLQIDVLANGAKVVPPVEPPGRLNSRKHAHDEKASAITGKRIRNCRFSWLQCRQGSEQGATFSYRACRRFPRRCWPIILQLPLGVDL